MTVLVPLGRAECVGVLSTHFPVLDDCFKAALARWQAWLQALDGTPTDVSPRSRANVLYDFITSEVVKRLGGHPDVQLRRSRGLLIVRIRNQVVLRFKKFTGKSLKTSSNRSLQTVAFEQHQLELPQGSLQPITHLVAGYLLDELAIGLEKVAITCSVDGKHFWAPIEITAASAGHTAKVHTVVTTDPTATKPGVRSARRKKDPQPDTGE